MTREQVKEELSCMPEEQQAHLAAGLLHLRCLHDRLTRLELARKTDDNDPSHWIPSTSCASVGRINW